jgi:flagellar motor switch protein FliM
MTTQEKTTREAAEPRLYDFRRPLTLAREHSRILELAFETFARQWGTQLTAKVRVLSQVTCEQVLMLTYDEYASGLPPTTSMVLCTLSDCEPRGVLQFPTGSALIWVNAMLGGTRRVEPVDRTFTPIEHALVRRLMDDALEDLKYSLGPVLPNMINVDAIQYHSQFAQAAPTSELMIIARFTIRVGEHGAEATVALPARVLLAQLGEANPTVPVENAKQLLHAQLAQVPVEVSARLSPVHVKHARVLGLRVGDVIRTAHPSHRPLEVTVGGHAIAAAAVGANRSRLAVVVTNPEEE